jgi:hypothetical protein
MLTLPALFKIQNAADFGGSLTNNDVLAWNSSAGKFELVAAGSLVSLTFEQLSDVSITSPAQGTLNYFNGTDWVALGPGASGQFLKTNGASANPSWGTPSGTEYSFESLTDSAITSPAQGDVIYYNGTNWVALGPGASGQYLLTQGSGANPTWWSNYDLQPVMVATTTNGTLSTAFANGQVVDGYTLVTGNRILLANQSTASQNGVYTVNASGAPTRSIDLPAGMGAAGACVSVTRGTVNGGTYFVCASLPGSDVVGTNSLTFQLGSIPAPPGAAQGATLFLGSNNWSELAAGATVGGFLKTGGAGANPSWSGVSYEDTHGVLHFQAAAGTVDALGSQSSAATINAYNGNIFTLTLTGNVTLTFSNFQAGQSVRLYVTQGGSGSYTLSYPTIKRPGGTNPTLSTTAGDIDCITIEYDGTNYYVSLVGNNYS